MKYMSDRAIVLSAFELGETQSVTPEGYLYCMGVPIARTGTQQYLNAELEPDAQGGKDGVIHVERRPEDVFHQDTIASFEGKPVTDDHPNEMLSPDNVGEHIVGTTLNVRKGSGDMSDYLIADLLIFDKDAIAAVRAGKRQVSCGYGSEYESLAPGRARQHTIIGNHVALVARGRCGPSCAIGDEDMVNKQKPSFAQKLKAFFDAEYDDGEEGMLTIKDEKPSNSGDIHIHVGGGPNDSTTMAPTADEDKEDEDDKKDSKDKKPSMDERMKAVEDSMKKMSDNMDAFMKKAGTKDKKSKDAKEDDDEEEAEGDTMDADEDKEDKDKKDTKDKKSKDAKEDDDEDDKDTKDADAEEEEGDAESEGSVVSADKKTKDKKKSTKDSAPVAGDFKTLVSDVEILAPGLKHPTFDSAAPLTDTMDSMCLLRRRALAASNKTEEGAEVLTMLNGGKPMDIKKLTCDSATVFFNSAVAFAADRNTDTGRLKKGKHTQDKGPPKTVHDFNAQAAEFYERQRPKVVTK